MADNSNVQMEESTDSADEALYRRRKRILKKLKITSCVMIVASLAWIAVGAVTIVKASPDNHFPYMVGGGCIGGGMSILFALLVLCISKEGEKRPTGKSSTSTSFKCIVRCQWVMEAFLWCGLLVGFGLSGIWGTIECALRTKDDDDSDFSLNFCEPDRNSLYILSILSLILGAFIMLLLFIMNCTFCCNFKAFGMQYHRHGRSAYIDYDAGEPTLTLPTLHELPANEPLYIRTEHGFQQVDIPVGVTPSAPPPPFDTTEDRRSHESKTKRESHERFAVDRTYNRSPHEARSRDRRPHNRHPNERRPNERQAGDRRAPDRRPPNQRSRSHDTRPREREYRPRRPHHPPDDTRSGRTENIRPVGEGGARHLGQESDKPDESQSKADEDPPPAYSEVLKSLKADDV